MIVYNNIIAHVSTKSKQILKNSKNKSQKIDLNLKLILLECIFIGISEQTRLNTVGDRYISSYPKLMNTNDVK